MRAASAARSRTRSSRRRRARASSPLRRTSRDGRLAREGGRTMSGALDDVIGMIFQVACWFVLARFILQASRADFYNPISQGVVKATDPLLKPMRVVIPGFKNIDTAALVLAWLLELAAYVLIDLIRYSALIHTWAFLALGSFVS